MFLHSYIKNTLGFSEYEIAQMQHFTLSIFSEISKLLLIGIFFYIQNKLPLFVMAAALLCILRCCTGGMHMEHYLTCLLMSFLVFFTAIDLLTYIPVSKPLQLCFLSFCILINHKYAPVVSRFRPAPDGVRIKKSKIESFFIIAFFSLLLFILPSNQYTTIGFWIIMLQSFQLAAAYYGKRRSEYEISSAEMDDNAV